MVVEARRARCGGKSFVLIPFLIGLGCAVLWAKTPTAPAINMAVAPANSMIQRPALPETYAPPMSSRLGMGFLRGRLLDRSRSSAQMQTVKTKAVPDISGSARGAESKKIDEVRLDGLKIDQASLPDLTGYDGPIVAPSAWHTGKDEPRSNVPWKDDVDEFKSLEFSGEIDEAELPSGSSRTSVIVNAVPKKRTSKMRKRKRRYANWYSKAEKQVERALNLARIAMAKED